MGELTADQASMWDIKAWGAQHPEKLLGLLNSNPRYVFFRELPDSYTAPVGALGVPLTEGYSIAVDPKNVPLGAPIFLSTTYPNSPNILNRLVFAQDTGIAIKGNVRADLFWGFGSYAETQASRMKQKGKMWVLLPRKAVRGRQDAALVKN
jgi:membrane-bound lytic murein transglycosylase A